MKIALAALVLVGCLFRVGAPVLGRGFSSMLDNYNVMAEEAVQVKADHADGLLVSLGEWSDTTIEGLDKATENLDFGQEEDTEVSGFTAVLFNWFMEGFE